MTKHILTFFTVISWVGLLSAQTLIHQFPEASNASQPRNFITVGNRTFFTANDGIHGEALWVTDGTEGGTRFVKDLVETDCITTVEYFNVTEHNGILIFFIKIDPDNCWLCRSDGTSEGTYVIQRFNYIQPGLIYNTKNGTCFFVNQGKDYMTDLWVTDGVKADKIAESFELSKTPVLKKGILYFASSVETSNEIWKTDGSTAGTKKIIDGFKYFSSDFDVAEPFIFYVNKNNIYRTHIQTAKVDTVPYFNQDFENVTDPYGTPTVINDKVVFMDKGVSTTTRYMWACDTSLKNPIKIQTITGYTLNNHIRRGITELKGKLYFDFYTSTNNGSTVNLLETDGTLDGTHFFYVTSKVIGLYNLQAIDSALFFMSDGESFSLKGRDSSVKKLNIPTNLFYAQNTAVLNNKIIGAQFDLTVLDLATEGVQQIAVNKQKTTYAEYYKFTRLNNDIYWVGSDIQNKATEILKTDNTFSNINTFLKINKTNPQFLSDFNDYDNELFVYKNQLVFPVYHNPDRLTRAYESLMISDGTPQGTKVLVDTVPNTNSRFRFFTTFKDKFVFRNFDSAFNKQSVWISDGTPEGTKRLLSLPPPFFLRVNSSFTEFKGELYFFGGNILWKSNGTPEGTIPVPELTNQTFNFDIASPPFKPIVLNEKLIIRNGYNSVWSFDGSKLENLYNDNFYQFYNGFGNLDFFTVGNKIYGSFYQNRLYSITESDGTIAGTKVISPPYKELIRNIQAFKNALFYIAEDTTGIFGFWKTDLLTYQTTLVKAFDNCRPKFYNSFRSMISVGDKLYFNGTDSEAGAELWETDGTTAGTKRVADINKGRGSSRPYGFYLMGKTLVFTADDGKGTKLYKLSVPTGTVTPAFNATAYPNPAKDIVTIESADKRPIDRLELINASGQVLTVLQPRTPSVELDISRQPAGLYIVVLKTGDVQTVRKIVKQ